MAKDNVFRYLVERLNISCSSSFSVPKQEPKEQKEPVGRNIAIPASTEEPISLNNKMCGAIVGFWLRGEKDLFRHLNGAILITLRALWAQDIKRNKQLALSPITPRTFPTRKVVLEFQTKTHGQQATNHLN
jgi:hypothetical protein